ncbi:hypothetical protein [Streptococcus uberis]|uniref:hypothetical protein n=1 Tax=Streptococcus uberis TaxID=1349 RepID=UPI001FF4A64A|nr:hypothetical protein [Streptococcus uberis]MCK1213298.1 hypothetical protein [Streptococcus uberis]
MKKDKYIVLSLLCAIATSNLSAVTVFAKDAQSVLTQARTVTDQTSDKAEEVSICVKALYNILKPFNYAVDSIGDSFNNIGKSFSKSFNWGY